MSEKIDVKHIANLARIEVSEEEAQSLEKDITTVLEYVDQVSKVSGSLNPQAGDVYNRLREDEDPLESGVYKDKILEEAPHAHDGFIKVKKIL